MSSIPDPLLLVESTPRLRHATSDRSKQIGNRRDDRAARADRPTPSSCSMRQPSPILNVSVASRRTASIRAAGADNGVRM